MAARGAWSKEQVWNKILETFPGSFVNEKEIRVPMVENGERIEIKVTLTAAKTNVGGDAGTASEEVSEGGQPHVVEDTVTVAPPSAEEKAQVSNLLAKLGL